MMYDVIVIGIECTMEEELLGFIDVKGEGRCLYRDVRDRGLSRQGGWVVTEVGLGCLRRREGKSQKGGWDVTLAQSAYELVDTLIGSSKSSSKGKLRDNPIREGGGEWGEKKEFQRVAVRRWVG